jgi:hypothetical protein
LNGGGGYGDSGGTEDEKVSTISAMKRKTLQQKRVFFQKLILKS